MTEIINLRRVRKQRARKADAAEAARNRARHGRTPAERQAEAARQDREGRILDGAKLDPSLGGDGEPRE